MEYGALTRLLTAWREAEADWERTPDDDPAVGAARVAVLRAWEAYNRAAGSIEPAEVVLVADSSRTYVGAFGPTERLLGWSSAELVGKTISDVTPGDALDDMDTSWRAFILAGRLEGEYRLRRADGGLVTTRFRARAHHPVNGLHVARHLPIDPA